MNWGYSTPPKIQGRATDRNHVNWIELDSAQWGAGRMIITKRQDISSPLLFQRQTSPPVTVLIDVIGDKGFYLIRLFEDQISGYSLTSAGESIILDFKKYKWGMGPAQVSYGRRLTPHDTLWPLSGSGDSWELAATSVSGYRRAPSPRP